MPSERDGSAAGARMSRRALVGWPLMMVGAAFLPGLIIALCVVVIVAIVHLAG